MKTYISLLRGINVSGQKKIKMADLKKLYEGFSFQSVQTYIQSGNMIFKTNINNIFLTRHEVDKTKLHFTFLNQIPNSNFVNALNSLKNLSDE